MVTHVNVMQSWVLKNFRGIQGLFSKEERPKTHRGAIFDFPVQWPDKLYRFRPKIGGETSCRSVLAYLEGVSRRSMQQLSVLCLAAAQFDLDSRCSCLPPKKQPEHHARLKLCTKYRTAGTYTHTYIQIQGKFPCPFSDRPGSHSTPFNQLPYRWKS